MKTRMWIVELDEYGWTDRKLSVDDPTPVPRRGEFIDGDLDGPSGFVELVQWNFSNQEIRTVYIFVRRKQ
jgi:hypothetical protein